MTTDTQLPPTDQTGEVPPFAPPQGPPASSRRSWRQVPVSRDKPNGKVSGVVAGLARAYGFDVRTTRIAVAIGSLALPLIVALYVACWLLLPPVPAEAMPIDQLVRDRRRLPLLIAIGLFITVTSIGSAGSWWLFGGLPWGLGLIALGVLLWMAPSLFDRHTDRVAAPTAPTAPAAPAAPATRADSTTPAAASAPTSLPLPSGQPAPAGHDGPSTTTPTTPATPTTPGATPTTPATTAAIITPLPTPSRPTRRRWPISALGALGAAVYAMVAAGGDTAGWWNVPILWGILVTLAILWVSHALAGIVNRRWSVIPGLIFLSIVAFPLVVARPDLDGGIGERTIRPTTAAEAAERHDLGIGKLTLDLTSVRDGLPDGTVVTVELGIGDLLIQVPADAEVELRSHVGGGTVMVDGDEITDGVDQTTNRTLPPTATSTADPERFVLDIEAGLGAVRIEHVAALVTIDAP